MDSQDKLHRVAFVHLFQRGHENICPPVTFPHQRPAQGTMGFQPSGDTDQGKAPAPTLAANTPKPKKMQP